MIASEALIVLLFLVGPLVLGGTLGARLRPRAPLVPALLIPALLWAWWIDLAWDDPGYDGVNVLSAIYLGGFELVLYAVGIAAGASAAAMRRR
jgi:hypothetical protein